MCIPLYVVVNTKVKKRVDLILDWMEDRMPLIAIGSVFSADDALSAIETGVPLIAMGRGLLFDENLISKTKEGREDEIISYFDPEKSRSSQHAIFIMESIC